MKASYLYVENGLDLSGRKLPSIPVIWLELRAGGKKFLGPCLMDTGFDGSVYANEDLALLLENCEIIGKTTLYAVGERTVECELFKVNGSLITKKGEKVMGLGDLLVYVPVSPEDLSYEVIVGREIINKLTVKLNGRVVEIL